jgi:hypothetical protein
VVCVAQWRGRIITGVLDSAWLPSRADAADDVARFAAWSLTPSDAPLLDRTGAEWINRKTCRRHIQSRFQPEARQGREFPLPQYGTPLRLDASGRFTERPGVGGHPKGPDLHRASQK